MLGQAFSPLGDSATVAASTSSAGAALAGAAGAGQSVRVYNAASAVAFVRFGAGAQTALATDTMVAPGATEVFTISDRVTNVAALLGAGTGNVLFQRGAGM
jgi:hypothetical protein